MNITPDELRRLVEAYGLPGEAERLRGLATGDVGDPLVRVWGDVGVDGEPPELFLSTLHRGELLMSSPALAAGMAVSNWAPFRTREGLWDAAVRAGREVLAEDPNELAKRADQAMVDRLGREIQTQAARFLEGLVLPEVPREPGGWGAREALPWHEALALCVSRRLLQRPRQAWEHLERVKVDWEQVEADREAWLRAREAEEPASLADGVPWLSFQLARFLRDELGAPDVADGWMERERERTARAAHPALPLELPPVCALPGWSYNVARHLSPGPGVSAALWSLALAVWEKRIFPELERRAERELRTIAPALTMPHRVAMASLVRAVDVHPEARAVLSGSVETRLAVAPGVDLETWRVAAGTLHTLPALRAFAWLAGAAWQAYRAGDRGHDGSAWSARVQGDGSVRVTVLGGLDGLGQVIGLQHKSAGQEVYSALEALAGVVLSAETSREAGLTGALVAQVSRTRGGGGRAGVVSCTLSPWWVPGAVQGLIAHRDRVIVPVLGVPPFEDLSPALRRLGAAMEERALIELAIHSRDVVTLGGVVLDWRALAGDLSWTHAERLLDVWQREGRWVDCGAGRWMLGDGDPDVSAAAELIREGGKIREHGAKGGKESGKVRRGERTRQGKRRL
jgi:hypothetical protein